MTPTCYSCIHCMDGADGAKRCRVEHEALRVNPALEADCKRYVREVGSDDQIPVWYAEAWEIGRGD